MNIHFIQYMNLNNHQYLYYYHHHNYNQFSNHHHIAKRIVRLIVLLHNRANINLGLFFNNLLLLLIIDNLNYRIDINCLSNIDIVYDYMMYISMNLGLNKLHSILNNLGNCQYMCSYIYHLHMYMHHLLI